MSNLGRHTRPLPPFEPAQDGMKGSFPYRAEQLYSTLPCPPYHPSAVGKDFSDFCGKYQRSIATHRIWAPSRSSSLVFCFCNKIRQIGLCCHECLLAWIQLSLSTYYDLGLHFFTYLDITRDTLYYCKWIRRLLLKLMLPLAIPGDCVGYEYAYKLCNCHALPVAEL